MNAIQIKDVTMRFGEVTALEHISTVFEENKIYGLLGRNGAGKSTLLNIISNRLFPTEGEVLINGMPGRENDIAQGKIYCMSEVTLYPESFRMQGCFATSQRFYPDFDMDYAMKLAEKFELNVKARVKNLSTGYASIFKLIIALACGAPYILLDEPVLGLDANHRELFYRELIENYSENPRTIIISTHLIEEVADIIEQVIIIKKGKILLDRPAEEVRKMGYSISGKVSDVDRYLEGKEILSIDSLGGLKTACLLGSAKDVPAELEVTPLDLQKLFIQLTNV